MAKRQADAPLCRRARKELRRARRQPFGDARYRFWGRDLPWARRPGLPDQASAFPGKAAEYRRRLIELQARCETLRDVPFTVTINESEIALTWSEPPAPVACGIADRVLALDLNPARLGWAVVDRLAEPGACRCVAWGVFEYPDFARRLGIASDDPRSLAHNHKRRYELAILAKKVAHSGEASPRLCRRHGTACIGARGPRQGQAV